MGSIRITDADRTALIGLARSAILRSLGRSAPEPALSPSLLKQKRGVFVTLRQGAELRGCIGYVEPVETIAEAVRHLAVKSASEDPRFARVHLSEMESLSIEISILSPIRPCADTSAITIGKHGLVIEKGWHRGLLLPEVAVEAGWDREAFLGYCCVKAGLPRNAWKDPDTKIFTFESEHLGVSPDMKASKEDHR